MCGRYTLTTPGGRALAGRFVVEDTFEPGTLERFNVCPTEPIAIVTADEGEDGGRLARTVRWGLVPPWARELGKGFQPINARAETAADKPPFAELMARPERRCLIVADGWYEWLKSEKKGGARLPFRYTVDGGEPFAFAGLWGRRRIDGELVPSACILTCPANAVAAPVHDRMPCVLAGPDEEAAWLAGEVDGLLAPLDPERTAVAAANPAVNKAGVEGVELLTP
jgi:putative SOS response-associated peptidase YedK